MNCQEILNNGQEKRVCKDITPFIDRVRSIVESHKINTGEYARYTIGDKAMIANEYGCADAANILYMIGDFPRDVEERACWISVLQNMQDKDTGLFHEDTHFPLHTTAHCISALELFDAGPLYKLTELNQYKTKEGLYGLLESLKWVESPWNNSHMGAGIYSALNVAGEATKEWNDWYFDWLWEEADPEFGLWRKGCINKDDPRIYVHMASTFHYLFNHEYAKMPLRYPEKVIDTCLYMYEKRYLLNSFGKQANFIEVDWVYCITRALRQCGHRYEECVRVVKAFADEYLEFLLNVQPDNIAVFDDLHLLFGVLCCVAELQQFLPGYIYSGKPLKLVLERRPFI